MYNILLYCNIILSREIIPRCVIQSCIIFSSRETFPIHLPSMVSMKKVQTMISQYDIKRPKQSTFTSARDTRSRRSCKFEHRTAYSAIVHSLRDVTSKFRLEQSILSFGILHAVAELLMSSPKYFNNKRQEQINRKKIAIITLRERILLIQQTISSFNR